MIRKTLVTENSFKERVNIFTRQKFVVREFLWIQWIVLLFLSKNWISLFFWGIASPIHRNFFEIIQNSPKTMGLKELGG